MSVTVSVSDICTSAGTTAATAGGLQTWQIALIAVLDEDGFVTTREYKTFRILSNTQFFFNLFFVCQVQTAEKTRDLCPDVRPHPHEWLQSARET